ncbi:MAG: D-amino-acid transaminase [Anaerolineae bacterium]
MIVYYNGAFMEQERVCISPDDRGFLFADGVYEVILAVQGRLFEADAHFARLKRSLAALSIPAPDLTELREKLKALLERNGLDQADARIYTQITRGVAPRGHAFPDGSVAPTIYASVETYTPPEEKWRDGVCAILVPDLRWARCDIKSLALLPNVLASQRAKEAGVYEAIFVREGVITEGSHTTVCAVFDGEVVTHPLTHHILGGVTRQVVLGICDLLTIPYQEVPIDQDDLERADELMLLGTTSGVMPLVAVERRPVADGKPGPVTRKIQTALRELIWPDGQDKDG